MRDDYEQIKMILLGLSFVSDSQYNRLIQVYGEEIVIDTIKELYNEDNSILLKVGKFVSDLYLNLDLSKEMKPAYYYYLDDLEIIEDMSSQSQKELLSDVVMMVKKLNKLFDKVENIENLKNEKIVPWISDKVEYCLSVCNNRDLLEKINILYSEYIEKRNYLLETYLKFVIMIAKRFHRDNGVPIEDLIQYGNMGLIRAIEMYDLDKDISFLTYAEYWISQNIIYNSKKMLSNFKNPIKFYELNIKRIRAIDTLTSSLGRMPTNEEIANYIGISISKLNEIIFLFSEPISLEDLIYGDEEMINNECDDMTGLADSNYEIDKDIIYEDLVSELEYFMDTCLNEREKFIIKSRYGFIEEKTLTELSKIYGISIQRISKICQEAIYKLYGNKEFKKMKIYLR